MSRRRRRKRKRRRRRRRMSYDLSDSFTHSLIHILSYLVFRDFAVNTLLVSTRLRKRFVMQVRSKFMISQNLTAPSFKLFLRIHSYSA